MVVYELAHLYIKSGNNIGDILLSLNVPTCSKVSVVISIIVNVL